VKPSSVKTKSQIAPLLRAPQAESNPVKTTLRSESAINGNVTKPAFKRFAECLLIWTVRAATR
jgi:hypothetical protein